MSDRFDDTEKAGLVGDDEHDIVEFSDDEGNTLLLEVMDYFFYNGDEYAVLMDADEEHEHHHDHEHHHHDHDHPHDHNHPHVHDEDEDEEDEENMYIMRVLNSINEDGEEMEEFVPVDDELLEQLVEVVKARFDDDDIIIDDDDDEEYDEDDDYDDDDDFEEDDDEPGVE
ncbi:hypothetical protein FACS1894184_08650 [Clostridia bacterium]|nr:hypothetical protein FACS1894184_08650 [Clostridia bacterium]